MLNILNALLNSRETEPPTPGIRDLASRKLMVQARAMAKARDRDWRLASRRGMAPDRFMEAMGMSSGGADTQAIAFAAMGRPDLAAIAQKRWEVQQDAASRDRMTQAQFGAGSPAMMEALTRGEDSKAARANQAWEIQRKALDDWLGMTPRGLATASASKTNVWGDYAENLARLNTLDRAGQLPKVPMLQLPGMAGWSMSGMQQQSPPPSQNLTPADELSLLPKEAEGENFLEQLLNRAAPQNAAEASPLVGLLRQRGVTPEMLKGRLDKYDPTRKSWLGRSWNSSFFPELRTQRVPYDPTALLSDFMPFLGRKEDPLLTQGRQRKLKTTNALIEALGLGG